MAGPATWDRPEVLAIAHRHIDHAGFTGRVMTDAGDGAGSLNMLVGTEGGAS